MSIQFLTALWMICVDHALYQLKSFKQKFTSLLCETVPHDWTIQPKTTIGPFSFPSFFFISLFSSIPLNIPMLWKSLTVITLSLITAIAGAPQQRPFMPPEEAHGQVWSLCGNSSSHLLRSYKGGVSVIPEYPKVGEDIQVMVNGYLGK